MCCKRPLPRATSNSTKKKNKGNAHCHPFSCITTNSQLQEPGGHSFWASPPTFLLRCWYPQSIVHYPIPFFPVTPWKWSWKFTTGFERLLCHRKLLSFGACHRPSRARRPKQRVNTPPAPRPHIIEKKTAVEVRGWSPQNSIFSWRLKPQTSDSSSYLSNFLLFS